MTTPAPSLFPAPSVGTQITSSEQMGSAIIEGQHFAQVRNVMPHTFFGEVDATHSLACFFVMPENTIAVRRARLWVARESFRATATGAASGGGSTSGSGGSSTPTSSSGGGSHSHNVTDAGAETGNQTASHTHTESGGGTTGNQSASHTHLYTHAILAASQSIDHTHDVTIASHTHSTPAHAHDLSFGIFEQASSADFSVDAADDGTTYVEVQSSTTPPINDLDITSVITRTEGVKRVRIQSDGLARVTVFLLLDLIVGVAPGGA